MCRFVGGEVRARKSCRAELFVELIGDVMIAVETVDPGLRCGVLVRVSQLFQFVEFVCI